MSLHCTQSANMPLV